MRRLRRAGAAALAAGLAIVLFQSVFIQNIAAGFDGPAPGMLALLSTFDTLGSAMAHGGVVAKLAGVVGSLPTVNQAPPPRTDAQRDAARRRLAASRDADQAARDAERPTD